MISRLNRLLVGLLFLCVGFGARADVNIVPPNVQGISGGGSVELGQRVVLTVSFIGAGGTQTYQWRKGGDDIAGETGVSYTIEAATPADAATYSVTVINAGGSSVASVDVVVKPAAAPVITANPSSRVLQVGQQATFSYAATGSYPRTHQWRKSGVDIPGATDPTYTIPAVTLSDAGTYSIVVTNSIGSAISVGASLTVNAATPPIISATSPFDNSFTQGGNYAISISIQSGSTPFTYQWRKGGVAIPGATSSQLQLNPVQLTDAGLYSVVVTNIAGSATSREANIVVIPATAPVFNYQPQGVTVFRGQSASFSFSVSGSSPLTYQWRKDGVPISGATSSSYSVSSTTAADAGSYTVVVSNVAGSITSSAAVLTVNAPVAPAFTTQLASATIDYGSSYSLNSPQITGSPPLTLQWRKNGIPLLNATSSSYSISPATSLSAGVYSLVVTNSAGSAASNDATITVRDPVLPVITQQPASQQVAMGVTAGFSVSYNASGAGSLSFQWRKDGVAIPGATSTSYSVGAVQASSGGDYTVVITGAAGTVSSNVAHLTVLPPSPPRVNYWPYDTTANIGGSASFSFSVDGTGPFTIQWFKDGVLLPSVSGTSYYNSNVTAADFGSYNVVVANAGGVVASSAFRLRPAARTSPWLATAQLGSVVYFLATSPSRIERYDLAGERWLATTYLSETQVPTAFLPAAEGTYVAYGRALARRSPDLTTETAVFNVASNITLLYAYDDFLYYNTAASDSSSFTYAAVRRSTLAAVPLSAFSTRTLVFSALQRRGYGFGGYYSSSPVIFSIGSDGKFTPDSTPTQYNDDVPAGARLILFPSEDYIANTGGTIFRTTDYSYVGSFGSDALDDLVFLASGAPVTLRDRTLSAYTATSFRETSRAAVGFSGFRAFASGSNVFVFGAQEAGTSNFRVGKFTPTAFAAPTTASVTTGEGERFSVDDAYCSGDGVVHLFSRSKAALVRWSAQTATYLPAIPLRGIPLLNSLSQGTASRALFYYNDGQVTAVPLQAGDAGESQVGTIGNRVWAITDLGPFTMFNVYNSSSSADRRLVLDNQGRSLYFSGWSYWGQGIAYEPVSHRLFSRGRFGVASMEYETVPDTGVLPAGTNQISNPVNSVDAPLRFNPEGTLVAAGNGRVLNIDLAEVGVLSNNILDAAWLPGGLYTIRAQNGGTEVQMWSRIRYLLGGSITLPGTPVRIFRLSDAQLVVVSSVLGAPTFSVINADLTGASALQPAFTTQPQSQAAAPGGSLSLSVAITGSSGLTNYQWARNGQLLAGVGGATLALNNLQPEMTGIYVATVAASNGSTQSTPAIVGVATTDKLAGSGSEVGSNIVHPNGNVYDQVLLQGAATSVTADAGQVTRISYVDLSDDIVQVEFGGAGTLTLVLTGISGPNPPAKYNQASVSYLKGHATIVITGADETTNVSVFSVGRANAVNQSLFRSDVTYDGVADLAGIAILSRNGKFGGVRAANSSFWSTTGLTGIYAPGVQFTGPVYVGNVNGFDQASARLILGSAADVRIAGGDLAQDNGRAVQVKGITQLRFVDGSTSHGGALPAKSNRGRLTEDGNDVTARIVINPGG